MAQFIPRFRQGFSTLVPHIKKFGEKAYGKLRNIGPGEVGMGYIAVGTVFTAYNFREIFDLEIVMYNSSGSFGKMFSIISAVVGFAWHCGTWPVGIILCDSRNKAKYINDRKERDEIKYQTW